MQGPMASDSTVFILQVRKLRPRAKLVQGRPQRESGTEKLCLRTHPPTHEPLGPRFWIPSRIFCHGCHSGCVQMALQKLIRNC